MGDVAGSFEVICIASRSAKRFQALELTFEVLGYESD